MVWARSTSAAASFARSAPIAATSASILRALLLRGPQRILHAAQFEPPPAQRVVSVRGLRRRRLPGRSLRRRLCRLRRRRRGALRGHGGGNERQSAKAIAKPSASGTAFIGSFPSAARQIGLNRFASAASPSSRNMAEARRRGAAALTRPARRSCPMRGQCKSEPVRGPPRQGAPPPLHSRGRTERPS